MADQDEIESGRPEEAPVGSAGSGLTSAEVAQTGSRGALAGLAAFLIAVPLTLLAMLVTSESERVERLDRAVADRLHDLVRGDPASGQTLIWLGRVSDPWFLRVSALALAAWLVMRGRRRAALWLAVTVVVGGLVGLGLKLVVQRTRPAFDEPVYVASGYSFPSGHALNSMLICSAVVMALWPMLGRAGRAVASGTATAVVLVVGFDRVALGVHYLTDVVAGWAVGLAVVAATAAALLGPDDVPRRARQQKPHHALTWPRALGPMLGRLVVGWLVIVSLLVGLGLLVTRVASDRWPLSDEDELSTSLERGRSELGDTLTLAWRTIGDTPVIVMTMLVIALILRLALGRWREGLFVIAATTGQAVVFTVTTSFVERARPDVEQMDPSPPTSSFPSGHASAALALYLSVAIVVLRNVRRRWLRLLLAALCLVPPILVAYARLYRGMHHPSDIAGSVVNAALCIWLAAHVVLTGPLPEDPTDEQDRADPTRVDAART